MPYYCTAIVPIYPKQGQIFVLRQLVEPFDAFLKISIIALNGGGKIFISRRLNSNQRKVLANKFTLFSNHNIIVHHHNDIFIILPYDTLILYAMNIINN